MDKGLNKWLFAFFVCILHGCGTLGGFNEIGFECNKKRIVSELDSFYRHNPQYNIPQKWDSLNDWTERGYDFLDSRLFYFNSGPEEMYYVTFLGSDTSGDLPARMAIRAISNGNPKWLLEKDLDRKEIERISTRFGMEVLSKILCRYSLTENWP